MNDTSTNEGGWPATSMRTFLNTDIYNALPKELRDVIIDTTVVSGHGSKSGEGNFTSTDKIYLLSEKEVGQSSNDTAYNETRLLDIYTSTENPNSGIILRRKYKDDQSYYWWLRTANKNATKTFMYVSQTISIKAMQASTNADVSPAFRIG